MRYPGAISGSACARGEFFEHRVVRRLGLVCAVKEQTSALRAMRVGTNPGVLVGESPGLNRGAAWILETCPNHALVGVRLALEIFGSRYALQIYGQSDVKFRDVNLQSQLRQSRNVCGDGARIVVEAGNVQLQSDAIDRYTTVFKIPDHGIVRVGFVVEAVTLCFVVKQQRLGIRFTGQRNACSMYAVPWPDKPIPGRLPRRVPRRAFLIQPLVHDIPGEHVARIVFHHGCDVLLQEL
jgi:hypothetical protein